MYTQWCIFAKKIPEFIYKTIKLFLNIDDFNLIKVFTLFITIYTTEYLCTCQLPISFGFIYFI